MDAALKTKDVADRLSFKLLASDMDVAAAARTVKVICSTSDVDRMGDIIVQEGIDLTSYRKNPVVLWGHDADAPVARAVQIGLINKQLQATVQFPEAGTDPDADRVYAKIKAGIVNAVSVGIIPRKSEPLDPQKPWAGKKILACELCEFSFVSIPANASCLVIGGRSFSGQQRHGSQGLFVQKDFTDRSSPRSPLSLQAEGDASGFKSLGEFLVAVREATVQHQTDRRLVRAPHGAGEVDPTGGGFLVPEIYSTSLIESIYQESQLWPFCSTDVRDGPVAGVKVPGVDETSRIDGSRFGGALSYWAAEADQVIGTKPRFRMVEFSAHKLIALVYASNELIADSPIFNAYIRRALMAECSFKLDAAIISGSGAGLPMGMLNSAALITVAKDTGQAAASITAPNLTGMWKRLPGPSRKNAVWLVHEDVTDQLDGLAALGQLNAALYSPSGTNGSPYALLKGRPVIEVEQCQPVGTVGDIILADLTKYLVIMNAPRLALSADFKFDTDESVFRFALRVDGKSLFSSAITPFTGSTTRSPFVALAAR